MQFSGVIALILATTIATPALAASDGEGAGDSAMPAVADSGAVHRDVLDNGLEVLVYPDHSMPVVSVNVWYRVGSRNESVGKRGLAHLLEHMMFKGSKSVAPEEHARRISEVGGVLNAFTSADVTAYWQKVTAEHLELVLRLEAERMTQLAITEEKLATEREVVKEEYRTGLQNDPVGRAFDMFQSRVLKGTPYAWTPAGNIEDLDQIVVEDLKSFYETYYVPNNAVLVIAGDVRPSEGIELARRYFGTLEAGDPPEVPPVDRPKPGRVDAGDMTLPIQLPVVLGGYVIPGIQHGDIPALEVAGRILSAGQSSRLHQQLVRGRQIAVAAIGVVQAYKDIGLFLTLALHTPDRAPGDVTEAMTDVVEGLATEPPTVRELQKAKNQLVAAKIFEQDSVQGIAEAVASAAVLLDDYRQFDERLQAYADVTAQDVTRVVQKYLRPGNFTVVQVQPSGQGGSGR